MHSIRDGIVVNIPWLIGDKQSKWDEMCIWVLDNIGLPGDRYETHPKEYCMEFRFIHEADAIWFILTWT